MTSEGSRPHRDLRKTKRGNDLQQTSTKHTESLEHSETSNVPVKNRAYVRDGWLFPSAGHEAANERLHLNTHMDSCVSGIAYYCTTVTNVHCKLHISHSAVH